MVVTDIMGVVAEDADEENGAPSEEGGVVVRCVEDDAEGKGVDVVPEEGGVLFGTAVGANCLLRALRAVLAGAPASRDRCST